MNEGKIEFHSIQEVLDHYVPKEPVTEETIAEINTEILAIIERVVQELINAATAPLRWRAAGKCDAEARYWADKAESTLFDSQVQKEHIICSLTAGNCAAAIREADDDT